MFTSASGPNGSPSFIETLEDRRLLSGVPPYAYGTDNDTAYGSDGTLHVAWYDANAGSLNYASRSSSGAWSSAVTIDAIPGSPRARPVSANTFRSPSTRRTARPSRTSTSRTAT